MIVLIAGSWLPRSYPMWVYCLYFMKDIPKDNNSKLHTECTSVILQCVYTVYISFRYLKKKKLHERKSAKESEQDKCLADLPK